MTMTNSDDPVVTVCGLKLNKSYSRNIELEIVAQYSVKTAQFLILISQYEPNFDCYSCHVRLHEATEQRNGTLQECIAWAQKRLPELVQEADAAMDEVRRWIR